MIRNCFNVRTFRGVQQHTTAEK